jgi:hypothetical protein
VATTAKVSADRQRELAWWRNERAAAERGLRQLRELRERALRDPESALEEAGYYGGLAAAYKRKVKAARRSISDAAAQFRAVWIASQQRQPRAREPRPRRRVRLRASTGTSSGSTDPPSPELDLDPPLPGCAGPVGVEAA